MDGTVIRTVIAFVIAPLVIPFALALVYLVCDLVHFPWFEAESYRGIVKGVSVVSAFAVLIGYLVTLMGAVPAFFIFRRKGWFQLRHYLVLGIILGAMPFAAYDLYILAFELSRSVSMGLRHSFFGVVPTLSRLMRDVPVASAWVSLGVICGVPASLVFWWVAVRKRGDNRLAT